jgi:iron(III) transport system substrate-binding protein
MAHILWNLFRLSLAIAVVIGIASAPASAESPDALIKAAKAEGKVVVDGPPIEEVRTVLTEAFEKRYGIPVSYISSGSSKSGARVRAERAAGKYLLDVFISGADTPILTFKKSGWLDKVEDVLVDPEVTDAKNWADGRLWYMDPDRQILRVLRYVTPQLAVNSKEIKPGEITTWRQLLDPKWKGKIVAKDPSVGGAGSSLTSYFYLEFGEQFVADLYKTQAPAISRDGRQMAEWLANGKYPISVGPNMTDVEDFQAHGHPIEVILPTDGPGILSGGFGSICLLDKAPNPNAAKLFVNWLASKEGQQLYSKATTSLSLRTDLDNGWAPPYIIPKKDIRYLDTYEYDFVLEKRNAAFAKVRKLLGL